jgi:AcrR family transcriptional regulator
MLSKEKILLVAAKEFATRGFDAVSMNDLSEITKLNKATLYHHFKDKKSLYKEVIRVEIKKLYLGFEESLDFEDKSGEELLVDYIKALVTTIKENPYIVSLILRELANYGINIDESLVPYIKNDLEYLSKITNKLNLKRKYKDIDIYVIFSLIHGTIQTFYSMQMSSLPIGSELELKQNKDKSLDYIAEYITDILLVALT